MEYNPHAIHEILVKIQEQMRCPQCSELVNVDFPSVKLAGDNFMLLQMKCESCNAFIVLHVTLTGKEVEMLKEAGMTNVSSQLQLEEPELKMLRDALKGCDGSFEKLFEKTKKEKKPEKENPDSPSAFA